MCLIRAVAVGPPPTETADAVRVDDSWDIMNNGSKVPGEREGEAMSVVGVRGEAAVGATPPVNVYEGNGQLSLAVPVAGTHPDQVRVVVASRSVTIDATPRYPQEEQHYHRREWRVGAWCAAVPLPADVDPARARATMHLGVLVVMAPLGVGGDPRDVPVIG